MAAIVFVGEIVVALVCAAIFALAATGRRDFSEWEISNLNKVAWLSGIVFVAVVGLLLSQVLPTP